MAPPRRPAELLEDRNRPSTAAPTTVPAPTDPAPDHPPAPIARSRHFRPVPPTPCPSTCGPGGDGDDGDGRAGSQFPTAGIRTRRLGGLGRDRVGSSHRLGSRRRRGDGGLGRRLRSRPGGCRRPCASGTLDRPDCRQLDLGRDLDSRACGWCEREIPRRDGGGGFLKGRSPARGEDERDGGCREYVAHMNSDSASELGRVYPETTVRRSHARAL